MDDDGYPTEEELAEISKVDWKSVLGLARALWQWPEFWRTEHNGKHVEHHVSTGGWSGNESIIGAMQENAPFWVMCWMSSRRGGHYVFEERYPTEP